TAGEQQRGQYRAEFPVQAQAEDQADLAGRAVGVQGAVRQQGQRQPDEGAADGDDRQRAGADLVDLAHELAGQVRGRAGGAQHRQGEQAGAAHRTHGGGERHQAASTRRGAASNGIGPSGSPSRNWRTSGSPLACSPPGVPENTIEPFAITIAWSATGKVSCTWWVTTMLVSP